MQLRDMLTVRDFSNVKKVSTKKPKYDRVEHKVLSSFADWMGSTYHRWPDFYTRFGGDGKIDLETFEQYVRWEGGYRGDTAELWSYFEGSDKGQVALRVFLDLRKNHGRSRDLQYGGVSGLQKLLVGKYSSLARAWRCVFDTEDTGRCCYSSFVKGCKQHGFSGDVKETWKEITEDKDRQITMKDWDPETERLMTVFCSLLAQRHGNNRDNWVSILRNSNAGGRVDKKEWVGICGGIGFSTKDSLTIFQCLDKANDGRIDQREFSKIGAIYSQEEIKKEKAEKAKEIQVTAHGTKRSGSPQGTRRQKADEHNKSVSWASQPGQVNAADLTLPGDEDHHRAPQCFEFVVELTRQEYNDYLRMRRADEVSEGKLSEREAARMFPGGVMPKAITFGTQASTFQEGPATPRGGSRRPSVTSESSRGGWNKA